MSDGTGKRSKQKSNKKDEKNERRRHQIETKIQRTKKIIEKLAKKKRGTNSSKCNHHINEYSKLSRHIALTRN